MAELRMPSLGADMEVGTVLEWLVKPGDTVKRGDIIAVVDTEKAAIEIEVYQSGVIERLIVQIGETVPVGAVLAMIKMIGGDGKPGVVQAPAEQQPAEQHGTEEALPVSPSEAAVPVSSPEPVPSKEVIRETPPTHIHATPMAKRLAEELGVDLSAVKGSGIGGAITKQDIEAAASAKAPQSSPARLRVSPLARRTAQESGVDLKQVTATGPDGAITKADVEKAAQAGPVPEVGPAPAATPAPERKVKPPPSAADRQAAMRRVIAAAMARSKREIPHYYLGAHIDMSRALAWLEAENQQRSVPERMLPFVLLLKAVALALRQVPELNGFWIDDAFKPGAGVHPGVAVSLRQGGLIAPAVHDADTKGLDALMRDLRDLVKRARTGVLRSSEVSDPTITISNLGDQGVETVFGVIYPPQVALVGFGKVVEKPWAQEGLIGVKPIVSATLSADHRASDGHRGGRFLAAVDRLLQEPDKL